MHLSCFSFKMKQTRTIIVETVLENPSFFWLVWNFHLLLIILFCKNLYYETVLKVRVLADMMPYHLQILYCVFSTNKDIPLHDHSTIIKHQEIYTDIVLHVVLRLKQCISDWDLSPPARLEPSENPPSVNWSHTPGFRTYEAQVLDVSSQKEFSERQIDR